MYSSKRHACRKLTIGACVFAAILIFLSPAFAQDAEPKNPEQKSPGQSAAKPPASEWQSWVPANTLLMFRLLQPQIEIDAVLNEFSAAIKADQKLQDAYGEKLDEVKNLLGTGSLSLDSIGIDGAAPISLSVVSLIPAPLFTIDLKVTNSENLIAQLKRLGTPEKDGETLLYTIPMGLAAILEDHLVLLVGNRMPSNPGDVINTFAKTSRSQPLLANPKVQELRKDIAKTSAYELYLQTGSIAPLLMMVNQQSARALSHVEGLLFHGNATEHNFVIDLIDSVQAPKAANKTVGSFLNTFPAAEGTISFGLENIYQTSKSLAEVLGMSPVLKEKLDHIQTLCDISAEALESALKNTHGAMLKYGNTDMVLIVNVPKSGSLRDVAFTVFKENGYVPTEIIAGTQIYFNSNDKSSLGFIGDYLVLCSVGERLQQRLSSPSARQGMIGDPELLKFSFSNIPIPPNMGSFPAVFEQFYRDLTLTGSLKSHSLGLQLSLVGEGVESMANFSIKILAETLSAQTDNRAHIVKSDAVKIFAAADMYKLKHYKYPKSLEELMSPPDGGAFFARMPLDPWSKKPYLFEIVQGHVQITSYGSDMKKGGTGHAADIVLNSGSN